MLASILERTDVRVVPDLTQDAWSVEIPGARHVVREWTWGERRRLVDAAARPGQALDADALIRGMLDLLVDPVPTGDAAVILAAIALRLLGVVPGAETPTLLEAEGRLARWWGFGPAELDRQPAARLDRHVAALAPVAPAATPVADGGWTRIEVHDG